jgi:DNA-directed RNA polymerase subunit RPC12/RpoP
MKLTCSKCQGTYFKDIEKSKEIEIESNTKSYECTNCGSIEIIKIKKPVKVKQFHIEIEINNKKTN